MGEEFNGKLVDEVDGSEGRDVASFKLPRSTYYDIVFRGCVIS